MRGGEMRGGEPRGGPGEPRPGLGSARAEIPSRGDSPRVKGTTGLFAMGAGGPTPVGGMMGGAGAPGSGTVSGRGMQVPVGAQVKTQVNPNVSFRVNAPAEQAKTATVPAVPVQKAPASKVVGFLVSYDKDAHGEVYEVRAGRWLLTSRPTDHGDYILVNDESISPLHAIVRATKEGKIQVLDQLSEFGTGVIRAGAEQEEEVAGAMVGVDHGDSIRFGERFFVVVTIPKGRKTPQAGGE